MGVKGGQKTDHCAQADARCSIREPIGSGAVIQWGREPMHKAGDQHRPPPPFLNPSRGETIVISAWDVYWVMQLDSIIQLFGIFGIIGLLVGVISLMIALFQRNSTWGTEAETAKTFLPYCKALTVTALICVTLSAFLPSTKTAAAMFILPVLTSDTVVEAVAPEARELYDLAKDALRSVSTKATAPVPVEPKTEK